MSQWDEAYSNGDYLKHWDYRNPSQELVATIATLNLPRGAAALDLGCGAGREAIFLSEQGLQVYGVDSSREALRIAKLRAAQKGIVARWICADAAHLPLPSHVIDFVNDRGCFHVIPNSRRRSVARELWRVMKPGARILLRGSSRRGREGFVPVTRKAVEHFFDKRHFSYGPLLPISMVSDSGSLLGNLIILTSK